VAVQAIVADPDVPTTMHLHQVQEPSPGPGQVVIAVQHISLNFGDLDDARSGRVPPGAVLGADVAGVVTQAAGNGAGPRVGTRVVALANGGFAQRIAFDADSVAAVPQPWICPTRQRYPLPALLHYVHCGPVARCSPSEC
jgi:NADPH:quinone reductase